MAKKPTAGDRAEAKRIAQFDTIVSSYERAFESWESRVNKILKRYRDERTQGQVKAARFNILWANVQTLVPATFSRIPKPDVSRRFRDTDPVGRVAGLILERALSFEVEHYPDYRATLKQCIQDRFLGGRGTAWARYEPHIQAIKQQLPEDGEQVTEDTDDAPEDEELEYECAPVDYVHWRDFGHNVARTWEEVTIVWRKVYMTRAACVERFGSSLGDKIPMDSRPESDKDKSANDDQNSRALIYEAWDKEAGDAFWFSKSMGKILDTKSDPLKLEGFFPCPKPLFATLTNDSLIPVPDFSLYQDQALELDVLSDRIAGLIRALQIKGVYDASVPELRRLFTEGASQDLIPVNNWQAFSEKSGLKGALDLVDLAPIAAALAQSYESMRQVKDQVYEITGISDIIRGQTEASETATAQQMKGQYASLRLKDYQQQVAMFATEALRLKAQIMCGKYDAATICKMAAVDQMSPADKALVYPPVPMPPQPQQMGQAPQQPQMGPPASGADGKPLPIGPAIQLLLGDRVNDPESDTPNPLRAFRVEIDADTLVQMDEQAEQRARSEFLVSIGGFLEKALPVVQAAPDAGGLVLELMKFGVTGFKVGKQLEGTIDEAIDRMAQAAKQPKPQQPNPEMMKIQAQQQSDGARLQHEQQMAQMNAQLENQKLQMESAARDKELQAETVRTQADMQARAQLEQWKMDYQGQIKDKELAAQNDLEIRRAQIQADLDDRRMEFEGAVKILLAQIAAKSSLDQASISAEQAAGERVNEELGGKEMIQPLMDMHTEALGAIKGVMQQMARPKRVIRDEAGRVSGVE